MLVLQNKCLVYRLLKAGEGVSYQLMQRPAQVHPSRQEYRIKKKKDELEPMQVDSGKAPVTNAVQVEDGKDKIQDAQKGPMIIEKSVNASQKLVLANDQEASGSNFKDQDKDRYL